MTDLTIIQQNDTHGYIHPHDELFWESHAPAYRKTGGFARIAAYVKRLRRQSPNVLYVDGGDLIHGTGPLVLSKGFAVIPLLNAMTIDAGVPGNWDFAYGREALESLARQLSFPLLACNLTGDSVKRQIFPPYVIREYKDCRVGLVGLTYPYVVETMPPSFSEGLTFSLGVDELSVQIAKLREERVDFIIVVSHMGLPLDVKLAGLVDGIDLILSAHSHDRLGQPIEKNGCLIVQSGSNASFLGRIDLEIENGRLVAAKHELLPLTADDFKEDAEINAMIDEIMRPYRDVLSEPVGKILTPLHRMSLNEAPMDKLITDAYLAYTGADAAFSHGWRYGAPVLPGVVTMAELYNIIPTNPQLFLLEMDGHALVQALEANLEQVFAADPFHQKGGYVLRSSNLMMAYKPYNPAGHRIQHLEINGSPLRRDRIYRIAGGGEQLFKQHTERTMLDSRAFDVLKTYFKQSEGIAIEQQPSVIPI